MEIQEILYTGKSLKGMFENGIDTKKVRDILENTQTAIGEDENFYTGEKNDESYLNIEVRKIDDVKFLCSSVSVKKVSEGEL